MSEENQNLNPVQFYHGTSHTFEPGQTVDPSAEHPQNWAASGRGHMYITSSREAAQAFAGMSAERHPEGQPHVYSVEPTGEVHKDWSAARQTLGETFYKTPHPVKITGELGKQ